MEGSVLGAYKDGPYKMIMRVFADRVFYTFLCHYSRWIRSHFIQLNPTTCCQDHKTVQWNFSIQEHMRLPLCLSQKLIVWGKHFNGNLIALLKIVFSMGWWFGIEMLKLFLLKRIVLNASKNIVTHVYYFLLI